MQLVDKDTLAYFSVLSGKAQSIPADQISRAKQGGKTVVCFVLAEDSTTTLSRLMGNAKEMDDIMRNVVRLISGLLQESRTGRNQFSRAIEKSEFYQFGLKGSTAQTTEELKKAADDLRRERNREAELIGAEARIKAEANNLKAKMLQKLADKTGADAKTAEAALDTYLKEAEERIKTQKEAESQKTKAHLDLMSELEKLK